jgi:V8-like Glu-specific endopeptidase
VDAALARVTADFKNEVAEIGVVSESDTAVLGMRVKKFGRTTSFTEGTITQVNATFSVSGYPGGAATFTDQIAFTADSGTFLEGGDSGSSLISEGNKVVGLCFAGSTAIGIANRWEHVVAGLNIIL